MHNQTSEIARGVLAGLIPREELVVVAVGFMNGRPAMVNKGFVLKDAIWVEDKARVERPKTWFFELHRPRDVAGYLTLRASLRQRHNLSLIHI